MFASSGEITPPCGVPRSLADRKSTRLNSSHTVIYTLSLHDALPISAGILPADPHVEDVMQENVRQQRRDHAALRRASIPGRSEEHTSELQSHRDLHSFPTRRSSDLSRDTPG